MDCLCAEPDGAYLCLKANAKTALFRATSLSIVMFNLCLIFFLGVVLGLYQRSWVKVAVGGIVLLL